MQKKLKIGLSLVLVVALIITVYASIITTQNITTSITIIATYGMEVYDTDGTTLLTSIDFGEHHRGDIFKTPSDVPCYTIKNIGEAAIWISYGVTDFPNDIQIEFVQHHTSPVNLGISQLDEIGTNPLQAGEYVVFQFKITIGSTAPFGSFTPTITFTSYDTASG